MGKYKVAYAGMYLNASEVEAALNYLDARLQKLEGGGEKDELIGITGKKVTYDDYEILHGQITKLSKHLAANYRNEIVVGEEVVDTALRVIAELQRRIDEAAQESADKDAKPKQFNNIDDLLAGMTEEGWSQWLDAFKSGGICKEEALANILESLKIWSQSDKPTQRQRVAEGFNKAIEILDRFGVYEVAITHYRTEGGWFVKVGDAGNDEYGMGGGDTLLEAMVGAKLLPPDVLEAAQDTADA